MRCRVFRPGAWQKIIVLLVAAAASANLQGQSQPTSISFSPGTVEQGECYTIRAGNAANMTLDLRYRSNGGATQTITGWPTLNASGEYSPCTSASHSSGHPCVHGLQEHVGHELALELRDGCGDGCAATRFFVIGFPIERKRHSRILQNV